MMQEPVSLTFIFATVGVILTISIIGILLITKK
jgi:hypothetical protein